MLIDDDKARGRLLRIACRLSADLVVRQDLMQEALVHLWLLEESRPGQTPSWYMQGCKYHLQNYLYAGRSIDSPKRNPNNRVSLNDQDVESDVASFEIESGDEFFEQISARDLFALLQGRLSPIETTILNLLSEGLGVREIALRLHVTHPTVIKYRRRIATLALRLGVAPAQPYARRAAMAAVV